MRSVKAVSWFNVVFLLVANAWAASAYAKGGLPDFTGLYAQNSPGVVNISTTSKHVSRRGLPRGLEIPELPEDHPLGDLLRKFFGELDEGGGGGGEEHSFNTKSLGSGFILSGDGYVVTNYHVIKDADEIIAKLSDRRELKAKVVGTDARSDIALLKIDAKDLPVLKIGSSENLKPGEWVVAIGSPFGFEHSITAGIVSAKGRSLPSENYVPFIQTDVAINPGNSGGPLFDMDGQVIGINSQIYSRTGGFMGLSFAIPIEVAMDVVDQIKTKGHVSRGWLGVVIQEVTRQLAESFGMSKPSGALVAHVLPDSPAQKAGLRVGDIIVAFNGKDVPNSGALPPMVGRTRVGETVPVVIIRDGRQKTIKVEIGELPEEPGSQMGGKTVTPHKELALGLEVAPLNDEQRKELGIDKGGVLVTEVHEGPAKSAGIRKGDVLRMINNTPITDAEQFRKLVKELPKGKFVSVLIQREGGPAFVPIKVPK